MEHVIQRFTWYYVPFTDIEIPFGGVNLATVLNTLLVIALLLGCLRYAVRRFRHVPDRAQAAVEVLVEFWDNLVGATFEGEEAAAPSKNQRLVPLLSAMFIFITASNAIVALPLPFIQEPTSDLNLTLAMGVFSLSYATYCGLIYGGVRHMLKEAAGPMWELEGATGITAFAGKLSVLLFFPIHVIGEISKALSLSFRLFGNIIGGATIMAVIFMLTRGLIFPLLLNSFFLAFEAAIQAFVFSMLTLVYIAVAAK